MLDVGGVGARSRVRGAAGLAVSPDETVRFNGRVRGAAPEFSAWAKQLRSQASGCRKEQGQ